MTSLGFKLKPSALFAVVVVDTYMEWYLLCCQSCSSMYYLFIVDSLSAAQLKRIIHVTTLFRCVVSKVVWCMQFALRY